MKLILFTATGAGIGLIPLFPGTFATVFSALIYWFFIPADILISGTIIVVAICVSVFISGEAEKRYSVKDDRRIVIDEIVGFWVAMYFIPKKLVFVVFGIVLFRLFDILKLPQPKKFQNLPGGLGIVLDDVIAGILTNLCLQILTRFTGLSNL